MDGVGEGMNDSSTEVVKITSVVMEGIMVVMTSIVKKSSVSEGEGKKLSVASRSLVTTSIS